MHHHSGRSYEPEFQPHTDLEWLIAVSDTIASGADRPEEPVSGGPMPSLPVKRSHLLSDGTLIADEVDGKELGYFVELLKKEFSQQELSETTFDRLLDFLGSSLITRVPADTRAPFNDTSLYHHLKLTSAIANCAYRDDQHGRNPDSYRLALVSGDADQIGTYVNQSLRIQDLRGRSSRIMCGSEAGAQVFEENLGRECVLFEGGGGFLALSPPNIAEELASEAKNAFEKVTDGRCTITTSFVEADGKQLKDNFGLVWEQAIRSVRDKKLASIRRIQLDETGQTCDICRSEKAIHEGRPLPTTPPRNELLCEHCFRIRTETVGTWIDTIKDDKGYLGILRMDGNGVGGLLSGKSLKDLKKSMTPSRLTAVSSLIHNMVQVKATNIVKKHGGETVYSGGDDLLALVPGRNVFQAAAEIAREYSASMANRGGISCGVSFARHKSPIYSALEASKELLDAAKSVHSGGVALLIAPAEGTSSRQIENLPIYPWSKFEEILNLAFSFEKSSSRQVRRIIEAIRNPPSQRWDPIEYGKDFVKYQMGRNQIPASEGQRLFEAMDDGTLVQAFSIYNTFVRE